MRRTGVQILTGVLILCACSSLAVSPESGDEEKPASSWLSLSDSEREDVERYATVRQAVLTDVSQAA